MNDKKNKILIIDDDTSTREMYAEIFKKSGYDVLDAEDGVVGLDKATKELPDVIFTGIIMPRMDGFTLIEALKKNVSTANIPVVISSHLGREEDQKRAIKMGAKDFIIRDMMSPNEVLRRVNSLFLLEGNMQFDPYSLDAPKISKGLGLNGNFQCMECDNKMVLRVKLINDQQGTFEAHFICPNCGWSVGK
jgi:DNA-binding response OmpR family regulator